MHVFRDTGVITFGGENFGSVTVTERGVRMAVKGNPTAYNHANHYSALWDRTKITYVLDNISITILKHEEIDLGATKYIRFSIVKEVRERRDDDLEEIWREESVREFVSDEELLLLDV